jgi:hypothetical protein
MDTPNPSVAKSDDKSLGKSEVVTIRLVEGTSRRIIRVLKGGEVLSAFVRAAVENELKRREKPKPVSRATNAA